MCTCEIRFTFWAISPKARTTLQCLRYELNIVVPVLVKIKFISAPTQPSILCNFAVLVLLAGAWLPGE
jgi:hypothetical protein